MNALIIEDDEATAQSICKMMEPLATDRQVARTLATAILALEDTDFDIITVDLGLPPLGRNDTIAAIPTLRNMAPKALIIVLTGLAMPDTAKECVDAGADALFEKTDVTTARSFMERLQQTVTALLKHPSSKTANIKILEAVTHAIGEYCKK